MNRQANTPDAEDVYCSSELHSWVVIGKGRHLFLNIDCPAPYESLSGVVEFADTQMRNDFDWRISRDGPPLMARMQPGRRVRSAFVEPDNRLEETYDLTVAQVECLQRDRLFDTPYFLLGPNSNSAMRAVCDECGVALPSHVLAGAGWLGEFPGINMSPGEEIPSEHWGEFGSLGSSP